MKHSVQCPVCDGSGILLNVYRLPPELEVIFRVDPYHELFMNAADPNWRDKYTKDESCFNCEGNGILEWEDL